MSERSTTPETGNALPHDARLLIGDAFSNYLAVNDLEYLFGVVMPTLLPELDDQASPIPEKIGLLHPNPFSEWEQRAAWDALQIVLAELRQPAWPNNEPQISDEHAAAVLAQFAHLALAEVG